MLTRVLRLPVAAALCAVLLLISCGGGTGSQALNSNSNGSGVGSGGTGSYTNGPISGLGSIIVNDVRYDVSNATVVTDNDSDTSTHMPDELTLGMVVEVQGSVVTDGVNGATATAAATTVRYASELIGKVTSPYDSACSCLRVLGLTVLVNTKTLQPDPLALGDVAEVYGLTDANGVYTATRIDKLHPSTATYKVAGPIVAVYASGAGQSVLMGQPGSTLTMDLTSVGGNAVPHGLAAGSRARVWFRATQAGASWVATRITLDSPLVEDEDDASLEGFVTQALDVNGQIRINGTPVSFAQLTPMPTVTVGQRIRVEGSLQGGVLVASEAPYSQSSQEVAEQDVELHGLISQLNKVAYTFTVRGLSVVYMPSEVHDSLENKVCVEVHGHAYDANNRLIATEVHVSDDCR